MSGVQVRDAVDMPRAPQLPIDPRIAARWISVRQDKARRRSRTVAGVLVAVTALVGAWILARSSVLAARKVVIVGVVHTSPAAVLAASGLDRHPPMYEVDAGTIRRRVQALPWVAQVSVRRDWPTTVTIGITERVPAAQIAGTAGQPAVVDAAGRVLAVGAVASRILGAASPALPVVLGLPLAGPPGTTLAPGSGGALKVLQALQSAQIRSPVASSSTPQPGTFTVTSITVAAGGIVIASLTPGPVSVVIGTTEQLDSKVSALRSVLAQLAPATQSTIDVQVADAPVLTTGPRGTSLSTTQRG